MGEFLGGSPPKSKSESYNKAYGFNLYNYAPTVGMGNAATAAWGDILGLTPQSTMIDTRFDGIKGNTSGLKYLSGPGGGGGGSGGNSLGALQNYFNSSGGNFLLNQGMDALGSKFGAMGLSKSGAAMKALEQYRHDLVSTKLDNYLGQLNELSRLGLGAGGLITSAGNYSKSKGTGATQGMGPLIGSVLSAVAASDRRAKTKIERLGDWDDRGDGLGKYRFAYNWAPDEMLVGVMADEVKALRPKAFVPNFARGYDGVNYALLGAA